MTTIRFRKLISVGNRLGVVLLLAFSCLLAQAGSHVIISDTLKNSTIYPGTTHTLQVYVPEQYTGEEPACLYVGLDGILCNAPEVMDTLIAVGKMPVTIGVFLQSGIIYDADGNVVRYNRSNEFDATTGKFASFLEKEVLPAVEALTDINGNPIRISNHAEDRMIFGLSSGGIAAFMAAWHRPDLFSRVFSGVGTFVSMRGGNDMPMWIRKCEPRPLKIYLQDGSEDVWNAIFGHWFEANKLMASALDFAGYTTDYDWSDGGHSPARATKIFADVMTWMWDGHPADILVGPTQNELLDRILLPDTEWEEGETPVEVPPTWGKLTYYPDMSIAVKAVEGSNCLNQVVVDDGVNKYEQPFYWLHSYDNALLKIGPMAFDAEGNLWVVTNAGIQICDQNGRVRAVISLPIGRENDDWKGLKIKDGSVTIIAGDKRNWSRPFNIKPPQRGVRPKSQGQG